MATQKVKWNQRVLGREVGDVEEIETDTDFMQTLLKQGRVEVVTDEPEKKSAKIDSVEPLISAAPSKNEEDDDDKPKAHRARRKPTQEELDGAEATADSKAKENDKPEA